MAKSEHNSKAVGWRANEGFSWPLLSILLLVPLISTVERGLDGCMLGFLFNDRECRELDYVLRKELDEMLFDLNDKRIDQEIKGAIESRYKVIFRMYARLATPKEISKYARNRNYQAQKK